MENSNQFTNERSAARRHTAVSVITYILLTLWALIVLFPFYWMVLTSVKSYSSYNAEHIPSFFTLTPTMQNYADAFTAVPLGKISSQYPYFHIGHHRHYDGRDHPLRFCFCKA